MNSSLYSDETLSDSGGSDDDDDDDDDDDASYGKKPTIFPRQIFSSSGEFNRDDIEGFVLNAIVWWRRSYVPTSNGRPFALRTLDASKEAIESWYVYRIMDTVTRDICRVFSIRCDAFSSVAIEWFRRYLRYDKPLINYIDDEAETRPTRAILGYPSSEPDPIDGGTVALASACILLAFKEYNRHTYTIDEVLALREPPLAPYRLSARLLTSVEMTVVRTLPLAVPTIADFYELFRALASPLLPRQATLRDFRRAALLAAVLQTPLSERPWLQAAAIVYLELAKALSQQQADFFLTADAIPLLARANVAYDDIHAIAATLADDIATVTERLAGGGGDAANRKRARDRRAPS